MNQFKYFKVDDWVADNSFREWIYAGELDVFWTKYIADNPQQLEEIEKARHFLLSIVDGTKKLADSEIENNVAEILSKIESDKKYDIGFWWKRSWLLAASILLICLSIGVLFLKRDVFQNGKLGLVEKTKNHQIYIVNNSSQIKFLQLPDGSSVILKKNASLTFPKIFENSKREVTLQGEAFFEIKKDKKHPFYVFSGEMVTKVTGTSFSIRAVAGEKDVHMVVKSGVVQVFAKNDSEHNSEVFRANQMVRFKNDTKTISVEDVDQPILINLPAEKTLFSFKRTPITQVLTQLEKAYGVTFVIENEKIKIQTLTAQLGDEPLESKLVMIGAAIGAEFKTEGELITIKK